MRSAQLVYDVQRELVMSKKKNILSYTSGFEDLTEDAKWRKLYFNLGLPGLVLGGSLKSDQLDLLTLFGIRRRAFLAGFYRLRGPQAVFQPTRAENVADLGEL